MSPWIAAAAIYVVPVFLLIVLYLRRQTRISAASLEVYSASVSSGLSEPASLHPTIDPSLCLGCGSCVSACPEKKVLGITGNRAKLISPASCIGHGACKEACPTNAIQLVFGTATRGVDIPSVDAHFQTNVPGIYIAGELGGMGLIRNAIEQGRQAVTSIAQNGRKSPGAVDIAIIGAGPAGISAAMAAVEQNLSYRVFEQDSIGGTIAHYPRGKIVMTAPATLPLIGEFQFGETSKETLVEFWENAVESTGLDIFTNTRVDSIKPEDKGFTIVADDSYRCSNVLLCIGRRGTPRKLNVPGENLPKVVYRLVDAEQYRGQRVIVVGGSDSALEAACSLADEQDTQVTLSYRGSAFNRAKPKNRERVEAAAAAGALQVLFESGIQRITEDEVVIRVGDQHRNFANDAVIVCAGGILPTKLLKSIGVEVETHFGAPV